MLRPRNFLGLPQQFGDTVLPAHPAYQNFPETSVNGGAHMAVRICGKLVVLSTGTGFPLKSENTEPAATNKIFYVVIY